MNEHVNVVKIRNTNYCSRRLCIACGGETGKAFVLAVLDQGDEAGEAAVCEECIEAGPDLINLRIIRHAEELESQAEHLRWSAEQMWELPTMQALEDARTLEDLEDGYP